MDGWRNTSYFLKVKQFYYLILHQCCLWVEMKVNLCPNLLQSWVGTRKNKGNAFRHVSVQSGAAAVSWWPWLTTQIASWNLRGQKGGEMMCREQSGPTPGTGQSCLIWPPTAKMCKLIQSSRAPCAPCPLTKSPLRVVLCSTSFSNQCQCCPYFIFYHNRKGRFPVLQGMAFAVGQHWVKRVVT